MRNPKNASRLICRVFRHSPVFRIGGDEFAAVLENDDFRNRVILVKEFEDMQKESNAKAAVPWDEVHVAMGIAVYGPDHDNTVNDTVRLADKLMYANKADYRAQ